MNLKDSLTFAMIWTAMIVLMWAYTGHSSRTNLKVRPEIENLSFTEALVSGHFVDWLYFTNKTISFIVISVLTFIFSRLIYDPVINN